MTMTNGSLKKISKDKYRGRINLPKGKNGKRKQASITIYAKSNKEATIKFEDWKSEIRKKKLIYTDVTVTDLVTMHYSLCQSKLKHRKLKPSTLKWYMHLSKRIISNLGNVIADEVTEENVQEFVDDLSGEIGNKYLVEHVKFLKVIYSYARRKGKIKSKLFEQTKDLIFPDAPSYNRPKVLNYNLINQLLGLVESNKMLKLVVQIALHTGMRRSEILALKWENICFSKNLIQVRKQLIKEGNEFILDDLKTKNSTREISITSELKVILQNHFEQQILHQEQFGLNENGYVVTDKLMNPVDPNLVTAWFRSVVKDTELQNYTLHCFRHTFASIMIYAAVDLLTLSRIMGHYSPEFTLKIYGHIFDDARNKAMKKYEEQLNQERTNLETNKINEDGDMQ